MADATIEISIRARGLRLARLLASIAHLCRSEWLLRQAVRIIHFDSRIGRGPWRLFLRARAEGSDIVLYEVER